MQDLTPTQSKYTRGEVNGKRGCGVDLLLVTSSLAKSCAEMKAAPIKLVPLLCDVYIEALDFHSLWVVSIHCKH